LPTLFKGNLYEDYERGLADLFTTTRGWCLKPEGTLIYTAWLARQPNCQKKNYYWEKMFRPERPQKGRLREFIQAGCEICDRSINEVFWMLMALEIIKEYGLEPELHYSYLGRKDSWDSYVSKIADEKGCSVDQARILLDKQGYGHVYSRLDASERFDLLEIVREVRKNYKTALLNPFLVRGLHYYSGLVFEIQWKGQALAGGGNYTGLLGKFTKRFSSFQSFGWALGVDRIVLAKEECSTL
jgi:histidyl-tRNA synthetase